MSNEIDILYRRTQDHTHRIEALERLTTKPTTPVPSEMRCCSRCWTDYLADEPGSSVRYVCPKCVPLDRYEAEQKPVDPPTREALEDVLTASFGGPDLRIGRVADAILAAFGPIKLRRRLMREQLDKIIKKEMDSPPDAYRRLAVRISDAVIAKLSELAEPVVPPVITDDQDGGQGVGACRECDGKIDYNDNLDAEVSGK